MFDKVLVANRGEIAVRVIRTCRELGIATVAVYSELDSHSLHVRLADEAYATGRSEREPRATSSPKRSWMPWREAVPTLCIPDMGSSLRTRRSPEPSRLAVQSSSGRLPAPSRPWATRSAPASPPARAGVASVPGRNEPITDPAEVIAFGKANGWPVAIKAAFGGGGRGMRVVANAADAASAMESAQREALSSFGHAEVYLERYLTWPRHIEMQVFADSQGNAVWLGERDCSCQRRHQKLVEESPAPGFEDERRQAMGAASVEICKACGYEGAGTVEFLYEDGSFYFLEMNTRLQVEHPVTELLTGLDLVEWQLRVAAGEPLPLSQEAIASLSRGHAIEARINAEDPSGRQLPPQPRDDHQAPPPGGLRGEVGLGLRVRRHRQPVLRQPGREDHRLGPRPRRRPPQAAAGPVGDGGRGRRDHNPG